MYKLKITGPKIDPCGTLHGIYLGHEHESDMLILRYRTDKYEQNHRRAIPEIPNCLCKHFKRISHSIVTIAAERSKKHRHDAWWTRLDEKALANQAMSAYIETEGLQGHCAWPRTCLPRTLDLQQIGMCLKTRADLEKLCRITLNRTGWHILHKTILEKQS